MTPGDVVLIPLPQAGGGPSELRPDAREISGPIGRIGRERLQRLRARPASLLAS
jgi:hypothetical protein